MQSIYLYENSHKKQKTTLTGSYYFALDWSDDSKKASP